jgi:hypothetical protein
VRLEDGEDVLEEIGLLVAHTRSRLTKWSGKEKLLCHLRAFVAIKSAA